MRLSYYIALYICGLISGPKLAVAWAGSYVTSRHSLVICSEEFNISPTMDLVAAALSLLPQCCYTEVFSRNSRLQNQACKKCIQRSYMESLNF